VIDCTGLLGLQDFDLEIDKLDERICQIRDKAVRMGADIQKAQDLLEKKAALLRKIQIRKKALENDLQSLTERLKTLELRMKTAGIAPSVYVAIEKECSGTKARISEAETKLLEDMEKVESLEKDNAKEQKILVGLRQQLDEVKKRQARELGEINRNKESVKDQRKMATLKIPCDILQVYEELRTEKKGQVVWNIEAPSCPACGFSLPGGFINPLIGVAGAEACPYCGVLIRWTGLLDSVR